MDAETVGTAVGLSGMIAIAVAMVKGLYPGEMPSRAVTATVAIVAALLVGVGVYGGEFTGTPLQLIGQWLMQAGAAIGFREGLVAALPAASKLPSNSGTGG